MQHNTATPPAVNRGPKSHTFAVIIPAKQYWSTIGLPHQLRAHATTTSFFTSGKRSRTGSNAVKQVLCNQFTQENRTQKILGTIRSFHSLKCTLFTMSTHATTINAEVSTWDIMKSVTSRHNAPAWAAVVPQAGSIPPPLQHTCSTTKLRGPTQHTMYTSTGLNVLCICHHGNCICNIQRHVHLPNHLATQRPTGTLLWPPFTPLLAVQSPSQQQLLGLAVTAPGPGAGCHRKLM